MLWNFAKFNDLSAFSFLKPLHQPQNQQFSSNIPTHKPNFQQTLPRYNPPPPAINTNPARRIIQRSRYSTGTTSLIPAPGSAQHTPLVSPALSQASSAQTSVGPQENPPKSLLPYPPSRIPGEMLKFQVRKSDADAAPSSAHPHSSTNAQIQVKKPCHHKKFETKHPITTYFG